MVLYLFICPVPASSGGNKAGNKALLVFIEKVSMLCYNYYIIITILEVNYMKGRYNESAENYLETILILSHKLPVVRSVDIANYMDFKKSSVSIAMKNLREKNHITVTDAGFIYLTESGKAIADMIYERHQLLTSFLTTLGVDPEIAEQDACKIEHVISKESFEAVKQYAREQKLTEN